MMGMPEGEEREQGIKNLCEKIVTENIPNPVKEIDAQVQEVQRDPNKKNPKTYTPRHRGWDKSRFAVVHMENNTIINK